MQPLERRGIFANQPVAGAGGEGEGEGGWIHSGCKLWYEYGVLRALLATMTQCTHAVCVCVCTVVLYKVLL